MTNENYEEQEIEEEESEVIPLKKYTITSYGADYTVDSLVKRMTDKNIYVPPFQRSYVWRFEQASRFIESLLLGLPVPGIFLSKEYDTQKLLVVDGQQRLRTLEYFYSGVFEPTGKKFALSSVQQEFEGATIDTLKPESRRRLDDSIIHATIMKQDEPSEDNSSIYYIFERLNTGGTPLSPQEIRTCIFQGDFCELLKILNENSTWRSIYGKPSRRLRDQELILRFFALFYNRNKYTKPMKHFLNVYMGRNRHLKYQSGKDLCDLFNSTMETAFGIMGEDVFKYKRGILASLFDCTMVGIARRLGKGPMKDMERAKENYMALLTDANFVNLILESTSDESNVASRLSMATKAFADVK